MANSAEFVDFTEYVSGPALMKACDKRRSFINVSGEWGRRLRRLAVEDGRDGPMQQLRTVMTNLYHKSGPDDQVGGMGYSDQDKNIANKASGIAYSMIGETTPQTFYSALSSSMIEDGFLSRFNIISYDGDRPKLNDSPVYYMEPELIERLTSLINVTIKAIEREHSREVTLDEQTTIALREYGEYCDKNINASGDNEAYRQMWNRAHIKVWRIAGILAASDNYMNPVINLQHFEWAKMLVTKDIEAMRSKLDGGDIGIGDEARQKKLLDVATTATAGGLSLIHI